MNEHCIGRAWLHIVTSLDDDILKTALGNLDAGLLAVFSEELGLFLLVQGHGVITSLGEV